MTKKSSNKKSDETEFLRDWCTEIIRFIGSLAPQPNPQTQFEQAIDETFQRGDLGGMRTISRDLLEWATGLSQQEQERLDEILHSKFGRGLRKESRRQS